MLNILSSWAIALSFFLTAIFAFTILISTANAKDIGSKNISAGEAGMVAENPVIHLNKNDVSELIEEIKKYQEETGSTKLDVTELVEKKILVGSDPSEVGAILKDAGFHVLSDKASAPSPEKLVYSYEYKKSFWDGLLGFDYEIRIAFNYSNNKISELRAYVFYHSL